MDREIQSIRIIAEKINDDSCDGVYFMEKNSVITANAFKYKTISVKVDGDHHSENFTSSHTHLLRSQPEFQNLLDISLVSVESQLFSRVLWHDLSADCTDCMNYRPLIRRTQICLALWEVAKTIPALQHLVKSSDYFASAVEIGLQEFFDNPVIRIVEPVKAMEYQAHFSHEKIVDTVVLGLNSPFQISSQPVHDAAKQFVTDFFADNHVFDYNGSNGHSVKFRWFLRPVPLNNVMEIILPDGIPLAQPEFVTKTMVSILLRLNYTPELPYVIRIRLVTSSLPAIPDYLSLGWNHVGATLMFDVHSNVEPSTIRSEFIHTTSSHLIRELTETVQRFIHMYTSCASRVGHSFRPELERIYGLEVDRNNQVIKLLRNHHAYNFAAPRLPYYMFDADDDEDDHDIIE
jgi:hypothetical protein